ncbi:MAG: phage tail tube protein [Eubacterium sp.]
MAEAVAKKVKRSDFATFLNTAPCSTENWARMGKGITSQKISYNAQSTSETYINEDSASTSIDSYAPTMDAPMTAYKGDAVFDYVDKLRQNRAVGADCETDVLMVYIYDSTGEGSSVTYSAEKQRVAISIEEFGGDGGGSNSLSFTLNFIGNAERGTCTITDGKPTFTKSV